MKEPILKAVAMPPRVFWAPMIPAIVNFATQVPLVFIWIALFEGNPIWAMWTVLAVHLVIIFYGAREPHLSHMMLAWGQSGPAMTKNIYFSRGNKFAP